MASDELQQASGEANNNTHVRVIFRVLHLPRLRQSDEDPLPGVLVLAPDDALGQPRLERLLLLGGGAHRLPEGVHGLDVVHLGLGLGWMVANRVGR